MPHYSSNWYYMTKSNKRLSQNNNSLGISYDKKHYTLIQIYKSFQVVLHYQINI